ncbi:hypothetical protein [Paenibacillus protaetiae]|uniref:Formylmethanofuran dehydrogenase subunit E domain-containing protein n=1 Tax=Paenibacillus protaetiae TaxID=2509456 RepID=A0A4V0YFE7_9BACL|nr:hypothetical protein [Paenibacillus protaetiae]QAY67451.1 hypothetical protein ET464_14695 [Paenibacillus protaetiae]
MSTIRIRDGKAVLDIGFPELRNYHGGSALMALAVGYRSLQAAFGLLFGEEAPERKSLKITSGHGGPGFRDAFEYVTRAVTRGAYKVDVHYPQGQYDPYRPQGYAFVFETADGRAAEVVLKPNFLPAVFYEYLKKGREGGLMEADAEAFDGLKLALCEKALAAEQAELLDVRLIR